MARATPGMFSTTLSTSPEAPGTLRPSSTGTSVETTCFWIGGRVTTISTSSPPGASGAGAASACSTSYVASSRLPASKVSSVRSPVSFSPSSVTACLPGGTAGRRKCPASSVTALGPSSTVTVTRGSGFFVPRARTTPSNTAVVGASTFIVNV